MKLLRSKISLVVLLILCLGLSFLSTRIPSSVAVMDGTGAITLTQETRDFLNTLDQDVTVTYYYEEGNESRTLLAILERYQECSSHVKLVAEPGDELTYNAIRIAYGSKSRQIESKDFYSADVSVVDRTVRRTILLEKQLNSTIYGLVSGTAPTVYYIVNHSETAIGDAIRQIFTDQGQDLVPLDLTGGIPEDASAIILAAPKTDLTEEEAAAVSAFLAAGGYMIHTSDVTSPEDTRPNLSAILAEFGMEKGNGIVVETEANAMFDPKYPYYFMPKMEQNEVSIQVASEGKPAALMMPHAIFMAPERDPNVELNALLYTSEGAYLKTGAEISTMDYEEGDATGPFLLAASAVNQETGARVDWYASSSVLVEENNEGIDYADVKLLAYSLNRVCGSATIETPANVLPDFTLTVPRSVQPIISLILVLIPLLFVAWGIINIARK